MLAVVVAAVPLVMAREHQYSSDGVTKAVSAATTQQQELETSAEAKATHIYTCTHTRIQESDGLAQAEQSFAGLSPFLGLPIFKGKTLITTT